MNKIVVGIDGSESSGRAMVWALREAQLHGWPVTAVMAWGLLDQHHRVVGADFDPHYNESDALDALNAYLEVAAGPVPETVERRVVCDLPARALLDASKEASLLVVGDRGLGGFRGLLLGSVSQHCLHYATCAVAVVRNVDAAAPDDSERVVVGIDGSEASHEALEWAAEEARVRGATLSIIHAWHAPFSAASPYGGSFDPSLLADSAQAVLDTAVERVDPAALAKPIDAVLAAGRAAPVILDASKSANLVVLGARGRGGFAELVLGSVSHSVVHHSSCPVVII